MKIKAKKNIRIHFTLSEKEARWLKEYVQNPIPDIRKCTVACETPITKDNYENYEDDFTRKCRKEIYTGLNEQLRG